MERLYRHQIDGTTEFYDLIKARLGTSDYILDLGCGIGRKETDLRDASKFVVGCDLGDDIWKNQFVSSKAQADAYDLPFENCVFDAVLMDYVLEHLADPKKCASELFRVLRGGGKLFLRTPNLFHYVALISNSTPHSFHRRILKWTGKTVDLDPFETYYRVNTRKSLRKCFEDVGFVTEEIKLVEKEPSYLLFARSALLAGYCYERLVNSTSLLAQLRSNLFGFLRKPV